METSSLDKENNSVYQAEGERGKIVTSIMQSSTKGIIIIFISLMVLMAFTYTQWSDGLMRRSSIVVIVLASSTIISFDNGVLVLSFFKIGARGGTGAARDQMQTSKIPPTPIILSCPTNTTMVTCHRDPHAILSLSPSPLPSPTRNIQKRDVSPSPSCPNYFRYIHEDLKPWKSTGITKEMVESAEPFANFRLVIVNGKAYMKKYRNSFQTRDVFTIWGILQLLNRYPGRIPDLDLMFNTNDTPVIKAANYQSKVPPPLFRYCKDGTSLEIVFPDWSFWGWAEVNIKPWNLFLDEIRNESESLKWKDRAPYAFWKGNPWVAKSRQDLLRCNPSKGNDWNARIFAQDWQKEIKNGYKESNLAKQCTYRYKIYIDGRSWSVSEKYILACNSPTLFVETSYIDFFSRGLMPGKHYWPINPDHKCNSIKFAVNWGNTHQTEAQVLGKEGSLFTKEELSMENVYDYMLHLLTEYANLLRYKPTIPDKASEICIESMACNTNGQVKKFMLDSMVKSVYEFEPCSLLPPFDKKELDEINSRKEQYLKNVEKMENGGKL